MNLKCKPLKIVCGLAGFAWMLECALPISSRFRLGLENAMIYGSAMAHAAMRPCYGHALGLFTGYCTVGSLQ